MVRVKPLLTRVDAALFDLDGTLVETNIDFPLMKREMIALALECGLEHDLVSDLDILAVVDAACEAVGDARASQALRGRAMDILREIEMRHAAATQHMPFARELIAALREHGIGIGVVTRNCRQASELSLRITRIEPDVLVSRDDTARHKPHPEPLHKALDALGAKVEAAVMVGDHTMDVECGKRAGMKTVGLLREDRPTDFFAQMAPDFVARDLREVLDAIIYHHR